MAGIRVLVPAVLFAAIASANAAESFVWGEPQNGLRIGMAIRGEEMRIAVQNVSQDHLDVLLGANSGYWVKFSAMTREGESIEVLNLAVPPAAGFVAPHIEGLQPGERYEFGLPMNRLVAVIERRDITVRQLLQQGCSLRAWLEVTSELSARWHGASPWIGKVSSGVWAE
jgi:hypothetical protein